MPKKKSGTAKKEKSKMEKRRSLRIAVLTGGGDAQGLNAAIEGIVYRAEYGGHRVFGFIDGWKGLLEEQFRELRKETVRNSYSQGGTIIGTSRTNPVKDEATKEKAIRNFKELGFDAVIAIGGEDTLGAAAKLYEAGIPAVGIPKTIDHDVLETEYTIGFQTAVSIVADSIEKLSTTAKSHRRIIVVEIMGRHSGWIALYGGLAGGANYILIPEIEPNIDDIVRVIKEKYGRGEQFAVIAVAEGVKLSDEDEKKVKIVDEYGHVKVGGVAEKLAKILQERTGYTAKHVVLGYLQRGGSPVAIDRTTPMLLGVKAVELVENGEFGKMVAMKGSKVVVVDLKKVSGGIKLIPKDLYEFARLFFD